MDPALSEILLQFNKLSTGQDKLVTCHELKQDISTGQDKLSTCNELKNDICVSKKKWQTKTTHGWPRAAQMS